MNPKAKILNHISNIRKLKKSLRSIIEKLSQIN